MSVPMPVHHRDASCCRRIDCLRQFRQTRTSRRLPSSECGRTGTRRRFESQPRKLVDRSYLGIELRVGGLCVALSSLFPRWHDSAAVAMYDPNSVVISPALLAPWTRSKSLANAVLGADLQTPLNRNGDSQNIGSKHRPKTKPQLPVRDPPVVPTAQRFVPSGSFPCTHCHPNQRAGGELLRW